MKNNWFEVYILKRVRNTPLHPLHKVAVAGLVVLVGLSFTLTNVNTLVQKQLDLMLSAVLPSVVVSLTNEERLAQNLATLSRNTMLDEAARLKAEHMRENDYFAHYSPNGVSPWYWFDLVRYDYAHAGENLAVYFDETKDVVDAWMESPLHRDNILKAEYSEIGVAAVKGRHEGYDTIFVVQLFGTAATSEQPRDVVEPSPEPLFVLETPTTNQPIKQEVQGDASVREDVPEEYRETPLVRRIEMDKNIVYVSDHISTSTGKIAAPVAPQKGGADAPTGMPGTAIPNTQTALQSLYVLISMAVVCILIVSIIIAQRRLQYVQMAYGVAILLVTLGIVTFHTQAVLASGVF